MRRMLAVLVALGALAVLVACAPTFPTNSTLVVVGNSDLVNIAWPAATDNDAGQTIASYRVDVDGVEVGRVSAPTRSCVLKGLGSGSHAVAITAYDSAGEWSGSQANGAGTLTATVSAPNPQGGTVHCLSTGRDDQVSVGNGQSSTTAAAAMSNDGRYIAYSSDATNLVPDDTNGARDLFFWDAADRSTRRISPDFGFSQVSMSGDGRYVAYDSLAAGLVPGDTDSTRDIFVWDRSTGSTTRIAAGDDSSWGPNISDDGRYVVFNSAATNLLAGDTNGISDVFVWDRLGSTTRLASGDGGVSISADGGSIAFAAKGTTSLPGGLTSKLNVYRWDRSTATITRVAAGNGDSYLPVISGDASTIVFHSFATDLGVGGTSCCTNVAWKRSTNSLSLVANSILAQWPSVSDDGRYATFNNGTLSVRDLVAGTTTAVSAGDGYQLIGGLSGDGRYVAYGHAFDVFRWDRLGSP